MLSVLVFVALSYDLIDLLWHSLFAQKLSIIGFWDIARGVVTVKTIKRFGHALFFDVATLRL